MVVQVSKAGKKAGGVKPAVQLKQPESVTIQLGNNCKRYVDAISGDVYVEDEIYYKTRDEAEALKRVKDDSGVRYFYEVRVRTLKAKPKVSVQRVIEQIGDDGEVVHSKKEFEEVVDDDEDDGDNGEMDTGSDFLRDNNGKRVGVRGDVEV